LENKTRDSGREGEIRSNHFIGALTYQVNACLFDINFHLTKAFFAQTTATFFNIMWRKAYWRWITRLHLEAE
jgi:hypothetical protein